MSSLEECIYLPSFDMKSNAFPHIRSAHIIAGRHCFLAPRIHRSLSTETLQSSLHKTLTSRKPHKIFDYLSPTPSHLLNVTLADFLPESCQVSNFVDGLFELPESEDSLKADIRRRHLLPAGHHLVYFPAQVTSSELLADGTDTLHSPGEPFTRRLWAGGSLKFGSQSPADQLATDHRRACCTETISDVRIGGFAGDEKVFVTIQREIGYADHRNGNTLPPAIVEYRNLVFLKQKSATAAEPEAGKLGRIIKPIQSPQFSVSVVPNSSLLFRFSALTFNAHGIHLDRQYCQQVEGYRDLLVHGPLSLVLMLSVIRSQLKQGETVLSFDYRNIAPLYANEAMKVCVRRDEIKKNKMDVWIEGRDGGYAVKGSATVEGMP